MTFQKHCMRTLFHTTVGSQLKIFTLILSYLVRKATKDALEQLVQMARPVQMVLLVKEERMAWRDPLDKRVKRVRQALKV